MKRIYCDICSEEITELNDLTPVASDLPAKGPKVYSPFKFAITACVKKDLNRDHYGYVGEKKERGIDFCLNCFIDAVKGMDKRPVEG